jgi:putative tryptophan/tyrosine transport system substrate-binding protein
MCWREQIVSSGDPAIQSAGILPHFLARANRPIDKMKGEHLPGSAQSKVAQLFVLFIYLLPTVFLAAGAQAQQPKKVMRLGYLSSQSPEHERTRVEGIRSALRERGYAEGTNVAFVYRYSEGNTDRAPQLAEELVRLNVDMILIAGGIHWISAAKNATKTIPIVMMGIGSDPAEAGLIESLARPGINVTGLTNLGGKLAGRRLEFLKEAAPKIGRVAVLYHPATPANVVEVKEDLPRAARTLNLNLSTRELRAGEELETIFAALRKERPDGLYVAAGPLIYANQNRIADFALKSRLPSMYSQPGSIETGGLLYYGAHLRTATGASPPTWTRFSKAPNQLTCLSSSRRNSSW